MKLATVLRELAKPEEERSSEHPFHLLDELNAYLITPDARQQRATGSFYPSGLEGCKRALAFNYLKAPVNDVHLEPRTMITFELGNHIHDRFQWMFGKIAKRNGWQFIPEMRILRLLNPWFISGRCDGVFILGNGDKEGIEIKSIHQDGFNRLYDRPLYEHQYQGNTYQKLLGFNRMHYLYVNKNSSQLKYFAVPFDRELFDEVAGKIERILLRLQDGRLPKRITPDCRDPKCKFNQVCHMTESDATRFTSDETLAELQEWQPLIFRRKRDGSITRREAA
jgi:hypothetical protein